MRTTAHDAWVKSTLGMKPSGAAAPTPLPAPAPDKQSQEFHGQFQAALAPIDAALAALAENAPDAKREPVEAKRDALVKVYQAAAAKVDPADESKAKGPIGQALGAVKGVQALATTAQKAAEKALADWQARVPKFDEAGRQLDEMLDWGHPKAPPLDAPLTAVRTQADAREYEAAAKAFDAAQAQIAPVHDDYVKQKAAQQEYDPAQQALTPRLSQASACQFKTLQPKQAELAPAQAATEQDAQAKDYVKALAKQKGLATKLDEYEKARTELEAKKQAYDTELAALQPKLDAAKQVDHKKLAPMQQDLAALQPPMQQKAEAEDFDGALRAAQELGTKADQFQQAVKELEQKKQEYDAKAAELQPRIDAAAQSEFKALEPIQTEIATAAQGMGTAAGAEEYDQALTQAGELTTKLDAFEQQKKQIEDQKKQYEDAHQQLDPKLQQIGLAPPHKALDADKAAIDDATGIMQKAADSQDYATALQSCQDLTGKADKYIADCQAIEDKKKQFDDAWAQVQPRLDQIKECRDDALAPMQQEILRNADDIQKAAADEDYDTALKSTETLQREFDEYASADASKIMMLEYPAGSGKKYYGTQVELDAVKLKLVKAGIDQALPPVKNRAEAFEGQHKDLAALNNQQYVVAFFVQAIGGADLGTVASAISTHQAALSALQSATSDADAAQAAYKAAVEAVNATGKAMAVYMDKLDFGGKVAVGTLQVVEVTCFAVAAACGGAILLPEGAGILASMAANGISGMGFGALEATAQQAAPMTQGEKVDWDKAKIEIGKAALLNGVGGVLGGAFGGRLKADVGKQIIERLGIENPEVQKRVLGALEGAMGNLVQAAISNRPDLAEGKMTTGQFVLVLVENAIAGGLGGAITPGMKKYPGGPVAG